jgi:predicted lipoprotein with Yx(FWY)xxD motif
MLAGAGAHEADFLALTTRTDGTKQWMASNKPLYTYIQDKKPGEVKGDNFHNVWHVVKVQQ